MNTNRINIQLLLLTVVCICSSYGFALDRSRRSNQGSGLLPNGANVCEFEESREVKVNVSAINEVFYTVTVKTKCEWGRECTRTAYRKKTKIVYHMVTQMKKFKVYYCCTGWKRAGESRECKIQSCSVAKLCFEAICAIPCQNNGRCTAPNTCTCTPGYGGKYCQNDINECSDQSKNRCQQVCINTRGGYHCGCRSGYTLDNNGFTCTDIDECSQSKCTCQPGDTVCQANCTNFPGGYTCTCRKGYRLDVFGVCKDINECIGNPDLCQHKCLNTQGGYRCSCHHGFRLNATSGKCNDINECKVNNGGCSQKCHNIFGGYTCSCKPGFYLHSDRRTCKAIQPPTQALIICEDFNNFKTLLCTGGKKIGILYAEFGRLSPNYCQYGNFTANTSCLAKGVMKYVSTNCDHKTTCSMLASKLMFGDPCPGTSKYLQIVYKCL